MSKGQLRLIDDAADRDKANLRKAKEELNLAKSNIEKLRSTASGMQGKTGTAISEKSKQLADALNELNENLDSTIMVINKIVQQVHEDDQRAARL
ncbi:MAG: hypothetical protein Q4C02_07055 [Eubacteriales bacterium]|nr:hypothetical protein [Eubacteriales bacterium]